MLSVDLSRIQIKDPSKPKVFSQWFLELDAGLQVTESFLRVDHVVDVREGGIATDLKSRS